MELEEYENADFYTAIKSVDGKRLTFKTPNQTVLWRVKTLFTKEPHTIQWISGMRPGATFVDVGANIGLYSLYAAKMQGVRVFAFEPESQNYALLNQNIHANQLSSQVTAFCCALTDRMGMSQLFLSEFRTGGSCHSFDAQVGFDLKPRNEAFAQGCLGWALDQAIADGVVTVPEYIKIDVDGFEHKVIAGALETLRNPAVRELLIEVNPSLPEHHVMVETLSELGFACDGVQAMMTMRKEGPFRGVGEWIFKRTPEQELSFSFPRKLFEQVAPQALHQEAWNHALERIRESDIQTAPYAFAVVDGIFPQEYFAQIRAHFPEEHQLQSLSQSSRVVSTRYQERHMLVLDEASIEAMDAERAEFWRGLAQQLCSPEFILGVIGKFMPHIANRLQVGAVQGDIELWGDALVISDRTRYSIGPHTDAPHRLLTFLFYLPEDESLEECGTSIYTPKNPKFACPGGPHYGFELFDRLGTVGFLPNRLLVFAKDVRSFHGVEPLLKENLDRRLIIYNVRLPVYVLGGGQGE